ncbi:hypothetical protein DCCM_0917 [Desulfocucumis palustris]|uniref:Uncharacterized protein n=1 Tax=Desulfocucumis palustris TaxID=1898651 RepID=A0A2L2XFS9_9FIRM|nr:hypothetical protein DCCM_0917 [Desulfocucumis palustris]
MQPVSLRYRGAGIKVLQYEPDARMSLWRLLKAGLKLGWYHG